MRKTSYRLGQHKDAKVVVGYILNQNQLLEASATVDAATLTHLEMPNRDGFYVDDRPDVSEQPCYKDCIGLQLTGKIR
ncbi:hypothetical protein [Pseudomonas gelidaquae]|uniref:hypothetical protein n=1 Tax=Pseudomonas sp. IB20 TaxID=1702250 RepID=UPI0015B64038|nr:hypothetical protein [Pseudomonas sp. IB20]